MSRFAKCVIRIPLLPLAVVAETYLFLSAVLWCQINTDTASNFITLSTRLPDIGWYFGSNKKAG